MSLFDQVKLQSILDTHSVSKESQSLNDDLLQRPWVYIQTICKRINTIPPERVSEIVIHVAAPKDNRGRTKKITIRDLSPQELGLIREELESEMSPSKDLLSIQTGEDTIEINIQPDISSVADLLLLEPWQFVRTLAELAGLDSDTITQIALGTVAPSDHRNLTKEITILVPNMDISNKLAEQLQKIAPAMTKRAISYDLTIDEKSGAISLQEIQGEPEVFFVKQGNFAVGKSEVQTAGLETCTALGILFSDGTKFLTHIDAQTDTSRMQNKVASLISSGLKVQQARVWYGSGMIGGVGADLSNQKVEVLINNLRLSFKPDFVPVTFLNTVGIDKSGSFFTK